MRTVLSIAAILIVSLPAWTQPANAQSLCRFVLGFAALRDQVGAQKVGSCLEDERFNLENGNAEQRTTGGLMVWRKIDNFTAFTDGGTTWVNGPNGLQSRPNGERFGWEKDPVQSVRTQPTAPVAVPIAPTSTSVPATPVPTPIATPRSNPTPRPSPPPPSGPDPVLMSRCVSVAGDMAEDLNQDLPPGSSAGGKAFEAFLGLCQLSVKTHGAMGFTCFETAFRRALRMNGLVRPGSSSAIDAAQAEYNLCIMAGSR